MKRMIGILVVAVLLALPLCAGATYLGDGVLNVDWSDPYSGGDPNYYADYDGTVKSSDFGYTTGLVEIFCVSPQDANGGDQNYSFYTITAGSALSQAAWIADNWFKYRGATDSNKAEAQKAIWKIMNVMDRIGFAGLDVALYNAALVQTNYVTNNWIYAQNPVVGGSGLGYQDYLTPYTPPPTQAPEPATMLLFGLGLLGLAGIRRKMK